MLPEKLRSHMVAPSLLIATTAKKALHFAFRLQTHKVSRIMTRRFNVLVVDDEPALRKVLQTSLAARGFCVEEAGSGEQAIDMVPEGGFDLVLLDINMPGMG